MVARQKSQRKLTARQKKIYQNKASAMSPDVLADIWKVNFNKTLEPDEIEQFELIRKAYKEKTGKELPKHVSQSKGK